MVNQSKRNACINNFSILLQKLVKYDRLSPKSAELAKEQYQKLFEIVDSNRKAFQDLILKVIGLIDSSQTSSEQINLSRCLECVQTSFCAFTWTVIH